MRTALAVALIAASLALVTAAGANTAPKLSKPGMRGLALAQTRCAACHGIAANQGSANPESPPFEDVANRPGLNEATLRQYLRDAHNYPEAMDFKLARSHARDLAAYIVTLQRPGYKPSI